MSAYTHKNLTEVEDMAAKQGGGDYMEARFPRKDLDASETGFAYHHVKPGKRQPFGHKHDEAEEVYVVLSGSGRVKLDDDIVELVQLDALRVEPGVMRQFEAGDEGLEILVFGPHHDGDGELAPNWWTD